MSPQSKTELSQLLSAYVDGELDEARARSVEAIVSENPEARRELEELKALRNLLAAKKRIPQSLGFWTRVSAELERRKRDDDNLLPFPRKYRPLVAVAAIVVVIAAAILLFQERANVVDYVSKQSERVQKAVADNVLQGSLMPLFSHVDKNQALQFAMFGTLPLDAKAQTELRVNEDSSRGYSIDVETKGSRRLTPVTVKEFVDEVRPTRVQLEVIDSLLDLGRLKLEGSVLMAEDRAMAVDPQLSRLNRVMLSGIAACLEPEQRVRFERFLRIRRAPFMIAGEHRGKESSDRILRTMSVSGTPDRFFVVTPETVLVSRLRIDMDSLRRHFRQLEGGELTVAMHMNNLIRRISEREIALREGPSVPVPHVRIVGDSDFFSIEIGNNWEGMPSLPREMWVKPRMPVQVGFPEGQGRQFFNLEFNGSDTSFNFDLDLDSLMIQMNREGGAAGFQFFKGKPGSRSEFYPFSAGRMKQMIDSALASKNRPHSKLDSLMREMERREMQREQKEKE